MNYQARVFLFLTMILFFFHCPALAQWKHTFNPTRSLKLGTEQGLSQVTVTSIAEDKDGFLWVGTQDGLNRFDGRWFMSFKFDPRDTTSVCGNQIASLTCDTEGRIWVGTINDGICYYDSESGRFSRPKLDSEANSILVKSTIEQIKCTGDSLLLNAGVTGIILLSKAGNNTWALKRLSLKSEHVPTAVQFDSKGNVWAGSDKGSIFSWDKNSRSHFTETTTGEPGRKVNSIEWIGEDLWVGSDDGLYFLSNDSEEIQKIEILTTFTNGSSDYSVLDLTIFQNKLWMASGNGLYCLGDPEQVSSQGSIIRFGEETSISISHNTVNSLHAHDNLLWIGTSSELNVFDFGELDFELIDDSGPNPLQSPIVFSIHKMSHRLWVGTTRGLHLFQGDTVFNYRESSKDQDAITDDIVRDVALDSSGYLWVATTYGISIIEMDSWDPINPKFIQVLSDPSDLDGLSDNMIRDIHVDPAGRIWIGTQEQGLNLFTGDLSTDDFSFRHFNHNPNDSNTISSNHIYHINHDNENSIWIGTQNGLNKISTSDENWESIEVTRFSHVQGIPGSLSDNAVHQVFFDSEDKLWCATKYGLNEYQGDGLFESYHEADGLPNEVIYSIEEDNLGNLWMGTNKGLACLTKNQDEIITYDKFDGTGNMEFNILASYRDEYGRMYFGGIEGISVFDPRILYKKWNLPSPFISEVFVPNQNEISSRIFKTRNLQLLNLHPDEVQLRYDQFPAQLNVAAPFMGPFRKPNFYYKLLPISPDWSLIEDDLKLELVGLPTGKYELLLSHDLRGYMEEQTESKMSIHVVPPWWLSVPAWTLYILAMLGIGLAVFGYVNKQILISRDNQRMKELEEMKTRFFVNVTHEFRTPLTVILGVVDQLMGNLSYSGEQLHSKLDMISRNGNRLLRLVNQLLIHAKIEKKRYTTPMVYGDLVPFVERVIQLCEDFGKLHQVNLIPYLETESVIMEYDATSLEEVLTNLIYNAIKFSEEGGRVIVHLSIRKDEREMVEIKVIDEGPGIPKSEVDRIFDRYYQVEDGANRRAEGTGIGLALVKELVAIMGAELNVISQVGHGSQFIVQLPLLGGASLGTDSPQKPLSNNISWDSDEFEGQKSMPSILVVEDNSDLLSYVSSLFEGSYITHHAKNGLDGLDKSRKVVPDLIISDIMMPGMDGLEMCRIIKQETLTAHVPIILLSAKTEISERIDGLKIGVDAYLTKPFSAEELKIRVEQLINTRRELRLKYSSPEFLQSKKSTENINDQFILQLRDVVYKNMLNSNFKLVHLFREMALSESQLYRKIKALTGKSTANYVRHLKLLYAKNLLETTNMTIVDVAYESGFADPAYFSRSYKAEFGISPSAQRSSG